MVHVEQLKMHCGGLLSLDNFSNCNRKFKVYVDACNGHERESGDRLLVTSADSQIFLMVGITIQIQAPSHGLKSLCARHEKQSQLG
jgi:hypothetical protein